MGTTRRNAVHIRRVYERPEASDGTRVLVDRVWPRALSKERAAIDAWFKDVAPTTNLRKWFGHDLARWKEFESRYRAELERNGVAVEELRALIRKGPVTLVYAARDEAHNNAVALAAYLRLKR